MQNTQISYTDPGTYSITLTAYNEFGEDVRTRSDYIEIFENTGISYCEPTSIVNNDDFIEYVIINNNTNSTGPGSGGYTLYSDIDFNLSAGQTFDISLSPHNLKNRNFWRVWFDKNGDGDFEDSDETLFTTNNKKGIVSGSLTIPADVSASGSRLRITMKTGSSPAACESNFLGEVENIISN